MPAPSAATDESLPQLLRLASVVNEHAIVSISDATGRIVEVNDLFCAISGYERHELLGQNHRLLKSGVHPPPFYDAMWATISAGETWHGEVCNRRKDGSEYWVRSTIVPFLDEHGLPEQYISIRTDITTVKAHEKALEVSEERLRRGQDFANIGTWDWDIENGELYWSDRIAPLFGYAPGTLQTSYENFLQAIHPDDRSAVDAAVRRCMEDDQPYEIEHRVVWPDGSERWLLERGAVIRDADGRPQHMLGVVQDIHERKLAELQLLVSERRLREAQSIGRMGNWEADLSSGELFWSAEIFRIFGQDPLAFRPSLEAYLAVVHPEDRALVEEQKRRSLKRGHYEATHRIVRPDGSVRHVHEVARPEFDSHGRLQKLSGTVQDVTERIAAEEHLALFRQVFDASGQCVGIADGKGHLLYQNLAMQTVLGYSDAEANGMPFTMLLPQEDADQLSARIFQLAQDGQTLIGQLPLRRRNGEVFTSFSNIGFVKDEYGRTRYIFNIFSDFTEELARRNELAQAKDAAERANHAKSDFLSSMSHELRTPMNAILGFAQLLEHDPTLDDDQQDNVREILKAGRHLLELINEVLDLARIESGHINLSMEAVHVADLFEDCRQLVQPLAAARSIALRGEIDPALAVHADRTRLKQVLLNLLSNAVKYNREGGRITVSTAPAETDTLQLAVEDTGQGIAPERLGELFQPFSRLGAEHTEVEGTGIGLTITRRLVDMMGGQIDATSSPGVGTIFRVRLPLHAAPLPLDGLPDAPDADIASPSNTQTHCILCIDDNPVNLKLIAQMLSRRPHLRLITAHAAELGIELARAHLPDLILLDINMPGLDGYQVLRLLRDDPKMGTIPVVAVTANAMPRDIDRGRAAGFADYLTKPLDMDHFLLSIDTCLATVPASSATSRPTQCPTP